jgi:hypothetical protein
MKAVGYIRTSAARDEIVTGAHLQLGPIDPRLTSRHRRALALSRPTRTSVAGNPSAARPRASRALSPASGSACTLWS